MIVVYMANLINVIMVFLFVARISGLPQVERVLGIVAMMMGFALGYIAVLNKKSKRDRWMTYLLIPIFLFFVVERSIDRSTFVSVGLSAIAKEAGKFVPSYYVTDALTSLFLRGAPVTSPAILLDMLVVTIYSVVVLMLGIILYGKYGKSEQT